MLKKLLLGVIVFFQLILIDESIYIGETAIGSSILDTMILEDYALEAIEVSRLNEYTNAKSFYESAMTLYQNEPGSIIVLEGEGESQKVYLYLTNEEYLDVLKIHADNLDEFHNTKGKIGNDSHLNLYSLQYYPHEKINPVIYYTYDYNSHNGSVPFYDWMVKVDPEARYYPKSWIFPEGDYESSMSSILALSGKEVSTNLKEIALEETYRYFLIFTALFFIIILSDSMKRSKAFAIHSMLGYAFKDIIWKEMKMPLFFANLSILVLIMLTHLLGIYEWNALAYQQLLIFHIMLCAGLALLYAFVYGSLNRWSLNALLKGYRFTKTTSIIDMIIKISACAYLLYGLSTTVSGIVTSVMQYQQQKDLIRENKGIIELMVDALSIHSNQEVLVSLENNEYPVMTYTPYILVNYENEQLQTVPTVETNNEYLNTQQIKDEQGEIIDFTNMEPTILIPEQYYEVYMKEEYHHQQICAYEEQNCRVMKIKDGQETIPLRADENMKEGKIQNAIFSNHPLNSSNIYLHQTERKEVEKYLKTIEITDYEFYTMEETSESMMKGLEESIVIAIKHFMIYGGLSILALIQFIVTETQMRKRRIAVEHFHGVPMMVSFRTIIGSIIVSDVIGVMVSGIILKDYFSWVLYLKEMWIVVVVIYMAIELLIVMKSIQYQGRESIQALLKGEE